MKAAVIGAKLHDKALEEAKIIEKALTDKGVKVDFSYFTTSTDQDAEQLEDTYKRNQKLLKNADFLIAEATDYSSGIGYLIASALNQKKPVLALHNTNRNAQPSNILKASSASKLLTFSEYGDDKTLSQRTADFANKVKGMLDTKFILIISPEIERYLEWSSDTRRMHKAQVVRQAVEEAMDKDKEYQDYLNENYGD